MHPFGGLPENLASFCALLRGQYGFHVGPGELVDAARALDVVSLTDQQTVRHALRAVLAGTRDDVAVFDEAFDRFFLEESPMGRPQEKSSTVRPEPGDEGRERSLSKRSSAAPSADSDKSPDAGPGPITPLAAGESGEGPPLAAASYSPMGAPATAEVELSAVDDGWVNAARVLVRRIYLGVSRRWRPGAKGRRFDLRRTLRTSLQTGGEPLVPRWLHRPRRTPRFVVLIDGSRSMSQHAGAALTVAAALMRATSRVEVFTFSTALQRVTTEVRRGIAGATRRLSLAEYAWGGGTCIGACLADFLQRFSEIGRASCRERV